MKTKKLLGFTLIELLIVIAIIGILAVAFLPTIMGAPAKGRDAARIADLQKIQKVLINENLGGTAYPASACIGTGTTFDTYKPALGGTLPKDPGTAAELKVLTGLGGAVTACTNQYTYVYKPKKAASDTTSDYSFGLYTRMETLKASNVKCSSLTSDAITFTAPAASDASTEYCYAVLTQ